MAMDNVGRIAACTVGGIIFGFAAEKGRVHIPTIIRNQMSMTQFAMMKMFLSAVAAGLFGFSLLYLIPYTRNSFLLVRQKYTSGFGAKKIAAFLFGGLFLGIGMTLAGSCPGMVLVQVGAGVQYSFVTLAGCYFGVFLYGILLPFISGLIFDKKVDSKEPGSWFDHKLGLPYFIPSLIFGAVLMVGLLFLELIHPWKSDVQVSPSDVGMLNQISWPPLIAGFVMGSLQLWISFSVADSLGGSSAYCTVLSKVGLKNYFSYFSSYANGIHNWWQVFYWVGAVSGSALSAYLSNTWGQAVGVDPWVGFLGGVLMLFGARLASGCTSGHGLSGMALLSSASLFIAVPAMFAGGMSTALLL